MWPISMRAAVGKLATETHIYSNGGTLRCAEEVFHRMRFALRNTFHTWLDFCYKRITQPQRGKNGEPDFDYFHA